MKNRVHIFALIIFLVALALRLCYALPQPATHWDEDEIVYLTIASNFVAGEGLILTEYRKAAFPPLYPLFLAGLLKTGFPIFPLARVVQSILGAISCLLLMGITRMVFSNENKAGAIDAGLIAALLMALYPVLVFYCARLMTENLFIFLTLSAIYALLKSFRSSHRFIWLFFGGAIVGLVILDRPTFLPFIAIAIVWFAIAFSENKKFLKSIIFFLIPIILVILPWEIRNYRVLGKIIPITSAGGANLYIANNPVSTGGSIGYRKLMEAGVFHLGDDEGEIEYNRYYWAKAFDFIKNNPGKFIRLAVKRLIWFYHLDYHYQGNPVMVMLFHSLLILAIIGGWLTRNQWRKTILLGLVILNFTMVHMIFLPEGRYRLPMIPILLAFASIPIFQSLHYLRMKHFK